MRLRFLAPVILVACGRPAVAPAPTTQTTTATVAPPSVPSVAGHVFDENGRPLPMAHLTPIGPDGKDLPHVPIAADGSFQLPIASTERITRVRVVGAGHRSQMIVVAPEDGAVDVTVKLGFFPATSEISPRALLFTDDGAPLQMTKEADGSYSRELTAPDGTYGYGILGVTVDPNVLVDGVEHEGYAAGKEHRDIILPQITVKGGKARVTYDPRKAASAATSVTFARPDSASAGLTEVQRRLDESADHSEVILNQFLKRKGGPQKDASAQIQAAKKADVASVRRDMATKATAARLPIVRQAASIAYFDDWKVESPSEEEKALARRVLAEVAVDDPLWSIAKSFSLALETADLPSSSTDQLREAFIAKQPVTSAVATFVIGQLAATKDEGERGRLATLMKNERFNGMFEQKWASNYDPDRLLANGKSVVFDVKPLDGNTKTNLTPKSFAGKVLLIDLWGTWCAPCVAEMPHLQDLYAKYGGEPKAGHTKRFEILSIALGNSADEIAAFRKTKDHAMPWVHGLAEAEYLEKFAGQAQGVPLFVLVDAQGKIIAGSPDLNPNTLPDVLDRALR